MLGGCVLANRLTENPKWNVLLIEAGDVETPFQSVPIVAPYSVFSKFNWGYSAEPQTEACQGKLIADVIFFNVKDVSFNSQDGKITDAVTHTAKRSAARA